MLSRMRTWFAGWGAGLSLLFVAGILGGTSLYLSRLRAESIDANLTISAMYAHAFEDYLGHSFNAIDLTLANGFDADQLPADPAEISRQMTAALRNAPYLRSLSLVDAQGRIVASSNAGNLGLAMNFDDFLPPASGTQEFLRIGRPWAGRDFGVGHPMNVATRDGFDGLSFIPVMKAIRRQQPVTLLAAVNPDYFLNNFSHMLQANQGVVEVLRYDGIMLMSTHEAIAPGSPHIESWLPDNLSEAEVGSYEQDASEYGVPMLTAYRASRLFPFLVVTHLDRDRVLLKWQQETRMILLIVLPALLALVILAIVMQMRRRQASQQQAQAQQALRESEERWSFALEGSGDGVWDWDLVGDKVFFSARWKQMFGYTEHEIGDMHSEWVRLVYPEDLPHVQAAQRDCLEGRTRHYTCEYRMRCKDGSWKWVLTRGMVASRDAAGKPLRMAGTHTDLTERKRIEEKMQLAASVYEVAAEAIVVTDADNRIISINPAFTGMTGYSAEETIGQTPAMLSSGRNDATLYQDMWRSLHETGQWKGEIWNRRKNGEIYAEWLSINTLFDAHGQVFRRIAMFSDITGRKNAEELIWKQASYDVLTGLPNRRLLFDRLTQEMNRTKRAGQTMALFFIDLDHFKEVNDSLGHDCGDQLLIEAAHRISNCVRASDTVARLGGDEFAVVLPNLDSPARAEQVAAAIIETLATPFSLNEQDAYVTGSIGISLYPDDGLDIESLMKYADQAMYVSKNNGRSCFNFFTETMQRNAQQRQQLIRDLHGALAAGQFEVHFQPIVELRDGAVSKAEALLRWHHPQLGMVSPAQFIPLAEETGLICAIGDWVFYQAANMAKRWQSALEAEGIHDRPIQISVNKSPRQFYTGATEESWLRHLQQLGLPANCIVVEITEGLMMEERASVASKLLQLRDSGIMVALDDFGTGYSSMSYLRKFDIDFLKIDQSFIRDMADNANDRVIAEAMIAMAHKLGMQVIAEGVETEQQRRMLAEAGCNFGQGYLFSKPLPADEFLARFQPVAQPA
ncbi:MAG TPA: GGDEF domain-containing protein [Oxalobacteraceae bacterium]|nr:GGDEF domain-containing protein [Oxalobacteraceae bacterium]